MVVPSRPLGGLRTLASYALVILVVVTIAAASIHFRESFGGRSPVIELLFVVIVAALSAGEGPALLAMLLGAAVLAYFFMPPVATVNVTQPVDQLHLVLFVVAGGLVALTTGQARSARRRRRDERERMARVDEERRRESAQTERIERALHDSEARLCRLWDANIIGVLRSNAEGDIIDSNDLGLKMLGVSREELRSGAIRWRDLTPAEHIHRDVTGIAEARALGACKPYEKDYLQPDGRRIPVLIGYARVDGEHEEFICFVLDLTEQKRAQAALAEQITKAITDHAGAALFMVDGQGRCTFMNPAAEAMIGFAFDEIAQRPLHDVVHRRCTATADGACALERALATCARVGTHDDVYVRKTGDAFPVVCSASPIERPGRPPMLLLEVRDVTVQTRIAAEREMLLDSERAARAELERVGRAKDEFVAMLSHELRTPLNAVLGFAALARRPGQSQQQLEKALAVVERNGRLLAQIIADLFDVSRIVSGKLHVERGPIDLPATIDVALESMRAAAEAKGITLRTAVTDVGAVVLGDATRLQQVVLNLLSNAIKFTPRGGRVEIALARRGAAIELVVSDDGQGIEPEFLPFVFDRFRQAEASMTRQHGGLGIGLAIVKHLVELHGGNVHAESEGPGRGARFVVTLPTQPLAPTLVTTTKAPCTLAGARILVVDDEPDAQELVKRLLEEQGARVVTAAAAAEALDVLASVRFDAVVSDIGMPGMDGYEMIRRVRAGSAARAVPAVALTAYARPEDRARALDAGYQAHIAKPVEPTEMLAIVAGLICAVAEARDGVQTTKSA
ncbi:two-component sensor histidine kinase [Minicystis rosea]|nr:two-component sensor histidine kinase [Minicystis rosea]